MELTSTVVADMFEVLRLAIFDGIVGDQDIQFKTIGGDLVCSIPFDEIVAEGAVTNEFYFRRNGSKIIRNLVSAASIETVAKFEIRDGSDVLVVSGTVGLPNSGSDITFNEVEWIPGQLALISQLKFIFPLES